MHDVLAIFALAVAVYALVLARKAVQLGMSASPASEWEQTMLRLSEDLLHTAEQVSAHLSHQSEELEALLERIERMRGTLQASLGERCGARIQPGSEATTQKGMTVSEDVPFDVDQRIRSLSLQGKSIRDIARQTRAAQEEVALRLKMSA